MSARRYDLPFPASRRDPTYEEHRTYATRYDSRQHGSLPPKYSDRTGDRTPARPSLRSSFRPSTARSRWPPSPTVEEEASALRKEAGHGIIHTNDDVSNRGEIDQEPLIIDIDLSGQGQPSSKASRRTAYGIGVPTPPSSDDDDRRRRDRRHAQKLEPAMIPEMRRTPSPYSSSTPRTATLSDSAFSSSFASTPRTVASAAPSSATSAPRSIPRSTPGSATIQDPVEHVPDHQASVDHGEKTPASLPSSGIPFDDDEMSDEERGLKRNERRSARYSFVKPPSNTDPSLLIQEDLSRRPAMPRQPQFSDVNRRRTESWMDTSKDHLMDGTRKPAPLKVASLVREASGQHSSTSPRIPSSSPSYAPPPRILPESFAAYPPSPPGSARVSLDHSRDPQPILARQTLQSSPESSRTNSPQPSPRHSPSMTASSSSWQGPFDGYPARSGLSSARHAIDPRPSPISPSPLRSAPVNRSDSLPYPVDDPFPPRKSPPGRSESLPYPVDDFVTAMPEERDHQYFPVPVRAAERSPTFANTMSRTAEPLPAASSRPILQRHQSHRDYFNLSATPTSNSAFPAARQTKLQQSLTIQISVATLATSVAAMPPCPRADYTSKYDDWYTVDDFDDFDVCPSCLESSFGETFYRDYFKPVRIGSRSRNAKTRCDFSLQWLRVAWLLTLARKNQDLQLIKDVHNHIRTGMDCSKTTASEWYTITSHETASPLHGFYICETDKGAVEKLLPLLKQRRFFVRAQLPSSRSHADPVIPTCALRTADNNRFQVYLDTLIELHELANAQPYPPQNLYFMDPFKQLVKRKLKTPECQRDNVLQGAEWHFMSALPEFSICEDCYQDHVAPLSQQGVDLAMRVNTRPALLPSCGRGARDSVSDISDLSNGASCALYSPRMRAVWRAATERHDVAYLSAVVRERREIETELQRKARPVIERLHKMDDLLDRAHKRGRQGEVERLEDEKTDLLDRLARYQEEWKRVE